MRDIRTDELKPMQLTITVEMTVVAETAPKGFINNLGDELASMLNKRLTETVGITHLKTDTWDLTLS